MTMNKSWNYIVLIIIVCFTVVSADKHYIKGGDNHLCTGIGINAGIYRGGLHATLLINDVIGITGRGYAEYKPKAAGALGEFKVKMPINSRFRPYLSIGGGGHMKKIDTVFNGQPFQEWLIMPTIKGAIGAEVRLGKKEKQSLSLEVGYLRGSADYTHTRTDIGDVNITKDTSTYEIKPITASLMYTVYFCNPQPVDKDNDGILDSIDKCPLDPEDMDRYQDDDGCPEPDNDFDKILDDRDACPNDSEDFDNFEDSDGCPEKDNDKDGIEDVYDQCPMDPEDKDGFQDEDGCIELDNDRDGILDTVDACPDIPENLNGFKDGDGCPDTIPVIKITKEPIVLKNVNFETGSDVLTRDSYIALDEVVQSLKVWEDVRIEIQGHTDAVGSARSNKELSYKRALSVKNYFVLQGISGRRLTAVGYGEERPKAENETAEGRAINRRVELKKID